MATACVLYNFNSSQRSCKSCVDYEHSSIYVGVPLCRYLTQSVSVPFICFQFKDVNHMWIKNICAFRTHAVFQKSTFFLFYVVWNHMWQFCPCRSKSLTHGWKETVRQWRSSPNFSLIHILIIFTCKTFTQLEMIHKHKISLSNGKWGMGKCFNVTCGFTRTGIWQYCVIITQYCWVMIWL